MAGPSQVQLAEAWAPIIFHDTAAEFTQKETGFNPVDHIVGLFFDDNLDLRDNGVNIYRVNNKKAEELKQLSPIYYSVIETESHWYINYIIYHAVDLNIFPHTHDTENIWTIVEKGQNFFGNLVMHVTNAHGYPMIYGPDVSEELEWRKRAGGGIGRYFLSWLDRFSKEHHEGRPEYVLNKAGGRHILLFVSSKTHAVYKFSSAAWSQGKGSGYVYVPQSCGVECEHIGSDLANPSPRIPYVLVNWDELHSRFLNSNDVFTDRKNLNANLNQADFFPRFLAPGFGENEARALLFHASSFKTPYKLSDPAKVHYFLSGSSRGISFRYIYNPYLRNSGVRNVWDQLADALSHH